MICPNCGAYLPDTAKLCHSCRMTFDVASIQAEDGVHENSSFNTLNINSFMDKDFVNPICGHTIKDENAEFCPKCGKPVVRNENSHMDDTLNRTFTPVNNATVKEIMPPTTKSFIPAEDISTEVRKQAINEEKKMIKANGGSKTWFIIGILASIATVIIYMVAHDQKTTSFFWGLVLSVFAFFMASKMRKRETELEILESGKRQYNLCPRCKGMNIESQIVQAGTVSTHGKTRVSDNINPLRPFTHTNIKQGKTVTQNQFASMFKCNDCGFVFSAPEVHYR